MIRYIIKRLLMMIPIMICVSLFLFLLLALTPGDPAFIALGATATEEQLDMFREQNGLNDPLIVQYGKYILKAAQGDLGISYSTRQSVSSMIAVRAPTTLTLSGIAMSCTIIVSLFLGVAMAVKQNSIFDNSMRVVTIIFTSMPQFWLAMMLILLLSVKLGWLPSGGLDTPASFIMPVVCLASQGITMCARTGRSSMLEVVNQDYIRTAKAKGLKGGKIIRRHALKNALLPMVSVYGRIVSHIFGGSVVLETVFGINGLGQMMTNALRQKDVPAILGSVIISAGVVTIVNLLTDLIYAFIDPRIKSKYVKNKKVKQIEISKTLPSITPVVLPGAAETAKADEQGAPQVAAVSPDVEYPPEYSLKVENAPRSGIEAPLPGTFTILAPPLKDPDESNTFGLEHIAMSKSAYKKRSLWADVWKRLRKNKTAVVGMVVFCVILLTCLASPLIYNYEGDILAINTKIQLEGPSSKHLLGVDELGRDILARMIWGGRTTLLISFCALLVSFILGTILGTAAAYYGHMTDTLIMRFIDIIMSIPPILLMITLATIMTPSTISLIFVVGLGCMPNQARMIRGQVLQVADNEYIEGARVQGASGLKIILSHILPNAISPIITTIILDIAYAVMVISTLSFLGLGVQPPDPEWGTMLSKGREYLRYAYHIATYPGIALTITLMSLTLVGDGMRDALDPRMKR